MLKRTCEEVKELISQGIIFTHEGLESILHFCKDTIFEKKQNS